MSHAASAGGGSREEDVQKVAELISGAGKIAMFTSRETDGTLVSMPMAVQEAEFDGDLWFYAERSSRKVENIGHDPQVNVTIGSATTWISLTGRASVVDDAARKRELWNSGVEAWFPDGPDDDEVILLKVTAESAEYWDTPGGRATTAISFIKAKVTGERIESGENEKVDL